MHSTLTPKLSDIDLTQVRNLEKYPLKPKRLVEERVRGLNKLEKKII
jgi:hypothetical protein